MEIQQFLPFEVSLQVLSYADGPYTDGSAGEQQVANLQRAELADVGDDFIDLEQHVCRVSALHSLSVNVQMEVQVLYVHKFFGGDEGSQYGRVVKPLAQFPREAFSPELILQVTGREVNAHGHSIVVPVCKAWRYVLAQSADAYHQFGFVVNPLREVGDEEGFPVFQYGRVGLHEDDRLLWC